MDIYTRRRENLRAYRDYLGNDTILADRLSRSISQIGQLIGPNPVRNIGNRLVREFEKTLNLPVESLDAPTEEAFKQAIALERLLAEGYAVQVVAQPMLRDGRTRYDGTQKRRSPKQILKVTQGGMSLDIIVEDENSPVRMQKFFEPTKELYLHTIGECEEVVGYVKNKMLYKVLSGDDEDPYKENTAPAPDNTGDVPLISWVQAGEWNGGNNDHLEYTPERWMPCPKKHSNRTFALRVKGDSMHAAQGKSYPEGSIIYVDADKKDPVSGDRVVARLRNSDEATFKVFMKEDNRVWLRPLNPGYPIIEDHFEVIGTVIGKWEDE